MMLRAIYLFRSISGFQMLKFAAVVSFILAAAIAVLVTLFPTLVLDWMEAGVLAHGSIEDINMMRRLRAGGS